MDAIQITARWKGVLPLVALLALAAPPASAQCWAERAKLQAADGEYWDYFGRVVSLSGDTLVVGAYADDTPPGPAQGSAYVFERDRGGAGRWGQTVKLLAPDRAEYDFFGVSVAISGDTIVVGAMGDDDAGVFTGSAYVFDRDQGGVDNWGLSAKFTASDRSDRDFYGVSVAIHGDTIVIGAEGGSIWNNRKKGAAYVYHRNQGVWSEVAKLIASDGQFGDKFGNCVAIWNDTVVVGALLADDRGLDSGSAYVFERDAGGPNQWGQTDELRCPDGAPQDQYGHLVTIQDDTIVVSSHGDDDLGQDSGSAYVFQRDVGLSSWHRVTKIVASDGLPGDVLGAYFVSLDGDRLAIGAVGTDDLGAQSGSAYLFERHRGGTDRWGQVRKFVAPDGAPSDHFGWGGTIEGDTLVVGAWYGDGAENDSGSAYVFELAPAPCPVSYGAPGTTANGCNATIYARGTASASAPSGFELAATAEGRRTGMFFFGVMGRYALPWGNPAMSCTSTLYVMTPLRRGALLTGTGTKGKCDGAYFYDLNAHWTARPAHNPGVGTTVDVQFWFRDPFNPCSDVGPASTTSLSNAIEFVVGP